MPNSFTSIGFATDATETFFALTERALERSEKTEVADGTAWRWACPSGAELWQHVDQSGRSAGLVPYFGGNSVVVARLDARVTWPDRAAAIGGFQAFALWFEGDDSGWAYPFVFEAPDFPCHAALDLPTAVALRIAAFAETITVHAGVAAYQAVKAEAGSLASQAFIPSGMFEPDGTPIEPPEPRAIINGHVRQVLRRVNSLSGLAYHWLELESYGGTYDAMIDDRLLDQPPPEGAVVSGTFRLCGRIIEVLPTEPPDRPAA